MSDEMKPGELTEQEVQRVLGLIDKLQQSGFGYLKLEVGELKLTLSKDGPLTAPVAPTAPAAPTPVPAVQATAPAPAAPAPDPVAQAAAASAPLVAPSTAPVAAEGQVINAPMVGRFYRAPQPGAPPFTEVGAKVTEESTLCIIEVMKVFNALTSGVRGVVTQILVADGDFVEFGQPLFVVKPHGAGQGSGS